MSESPLVIDYYSDVLCVWAWISQRRLKELKQEWGEDVDVQFHCMDIFGSTQARIEKQWSTKGGYQGFSEHVLAAAQPYDNAPVNQDVWNKVKPHSSLNAHLMIKAVHLLEGNVAAANLTYALQKSFFVDLLDISDMNLVKELADMNQLDVDVLTGLINSGQAAALLMSDYQSVKELNLKGSPTWLMNGKRQELFGNVGYRILSANIKEILNKPSHEASWC